ncbi:NrtA/SsuA/CpmA family ABC transporter substrate-binding protein [Actinomadura rayongensis]|uniref:Putative aliphatic sulfonates-binding protein n=1 Tax=Actinomadura rayongensis TaxID=1429076 RepID=A0A6I4W843_9ACTN|nr:NrtA/SsuA/CpmA family ABC transporter substrate-binding protein [Actinomadura rayongensis]MXQ64425.1 ABC transporter substrate-binding protein [Actinomadura rayongensis]
MTRIPARPTGLIAGVLAVLLAAAGCGGADAASGDVTFRVPDPGNSGVLALGKKDGSLAAALKAVHAKIAWTGSSGPFAPAAQEMNAGELDAAQGSITSAVAALGQKPGFKLFAAIAPDRFGEGILVGKDSPIRTVRDLVGKKVAVNKGGTAEYLLLKALEQEKIPADRVTRVYLNPAQTAPVFNSGKVDAWAVWANYSIPEIATAGARFLVTGGQIGSQNYSVWAVRTGFAKEHPEVVKAFYQYLHDAGTKQIQNPTAYVNVFTKAGPQAVSGTALALTLDNARKGATAQPIGATDLANFASVAKFFADQKVTPAPVDVAPHVLDPTGAGS